MKSVDEAEQEIRAAVRGLDSETVALDEGLSRILAADVIASRALPPWDNSAMDGFAVKSAEVPGTLLITATIAAGSVASASVKSKTCARIMTGAPVPDGADAVIMREDAEVSDDGEKVTFAAAATVGQHIRRAGEDIAPGDCPLKKGAALGPAEIAMLAALGHARVEVAKKPAVAIVSTGDELVPVGQDPGPGQIQSSNNHALAAQIREAGGVPLDLGIAPDDPTAITAAIERALASADIVVTSGGVSVGDFDFVHEALRKAGATIGFWKVAMKPGKPLVFGTAPPAKLIFGLPGNPVSSMVGFELFVRPTIRAMQGATEIHRPRAHAILEQPYRKPPGRAHYLRAMVTWRDGKLVANVLPKQGSGMLSSMVGVDALVEIAAETTEVSAGAEVTAILLRAV